MILKFLRSQLDIPLYCLWLITAAFVCNLSIVCGSNMDDDFAEFEDPDDSFTVDVTGPVPVQSSRHKKGEGADENLSENDFSQDSEIDEDSTTVLHATKSPSTDKTTLEDSVLEEESEDMRPGNDDDDDEEFEGLSLNQPIPNAQKTKSGKRNLIIAKVPHHLTRSWDNFHMEMLFILALMIYTLNFVIGRSKNTQLANTWFSAHQPLLEANFAVVGDDGHAEPGTKTLMKESEHLYSLWCTGSVHCDAMLIELRLVKRQCLFFAITNWIRPVHDSIVVKVIMDDSEMDGWVMAVGRKRRLQALSKDHQDLATYCPDKRGQRHQYLPESFMVLSEIPEVVPAIFNPLVCKFLNEFEESIEYLFFSDQYSGPKPPQDDTNAPTKPPVTQKALIFAFRYVPMSSKSKSFSSSLTMSNNESANQQPIESTTALFHFIFYVIEKVRRFHLSKDGKAKSERNRQRAHDSRLKSMHNQRQEAAQNRRGERLRAAKERIMAEDDPEKARKLEEKEQRKEKSKKMPKMKMLKMK
ncbi:Coiled-coil domain-containing protein isoform 2 [Schistosoma japonicum]|uniref:PAT complex subunit CCDC47 n=2 Tax=Schistosoma japonicum TaxID=6182 RepID=A0A4Z2D0F9_SCHJA|nr:Coiled-coil domain-containing protein isoform 2 [Schistosoma japonicum]